MSSMRLIALGLTLPLTFASAQAQEVDSTSAQMAARGKTVYEGKSGGALCFTCHGPQAKGVPGLGPDLTDGTWLHGDGGFTFLQTIVRSGVSKPKRASAVMPPMGGGQLSNEQLAALAVYLRSLK